jgi:hypothetical protein
VIHPGLSFCEEEEISVIDAAPRQTATRTHLSTSMLRLR